MKRSSAPRRSRDTTRISASDICTAIQNEICRSLGKFLPIKQRSKSRRSIGEFFQAIGHRYAACFGRISMPHTKGTRPPQLTGISSLIRRWRRSPFIEWASALRKGAVDSSIMTEWAHSRTGIDIHPAHKLVRISLSISARASVVAKRRNRPR